jgi:hypothetical protein
MCVCMAIVFILCKVTFKHSPAPKLNNCQIALLYCCFDGLLGWYQMAFANGQLYGISLNIESLVECITFII